MQQLVFSSKTNIALPSSFFTSYFGLKVKKQVISKIRNVKKIPRYIFLFESRFSKKDLEKLAKSPSLVDFVKFLWLLIMINLQ